MRKGMATGVDVFLPEVTEPGVPFVKWTEPYELPNTEGRWFARLEIDTYPQGRFNVGFYGTEKQITAILQSGGSTP